MNAASNVDAARCSPESLSGLAELGSEGAACGSPPAGRERGEVLHGLLEGAIRQFRARHATRRQSPGGGARATAETAGRSD